MTRDLHVSRSCSWTRRPSKKPKRLRQKRRLRMRLPKLRLTGKLRAILPLLPLPLPLRRPRRPKRKPLQRLLRKLQKPKRQRRRPKRRPKRKPPKQQQQQPPLHHRHLHHLRRGKSPYDSKMLLDGNSAFHFTYAILGRSVPECYLLCDVRLLIGISECRAWKTSSGKHFSTLRLLVPM